MLIIISEKNVSAAKISNAEEKGRNIIEDAKKRG